MMSNNNRFISAVKFCSGAIDVTVPGKTLFLSYSLVCNIKVLQPICLSAA